MKRLCKMWDNYNFLTFLGILLFLLVKPVKFLVLEVGFPGYDVFTDCDAAARFFQKKLVVFVCIF